MKPYPPARSKADILLVDDTPDNLRLLSAMLTRRGFEVRKALTGEWAIASVQADLPNLILLDIRMPEMDGYEVCRRLKADPQLCEVPIIFISALDDALDKVKAFEVGGVDYVTKPFQEAEVLARIENQLRLQHLQQQLLLQNEDLARSNRELEQFAYVVSHDLQQPIQSVTGFARLLMLKYKQDLDTTATDYLNRIYETGGRMQRLIQDLLAYAQTGKPDQEFQLVDCHSVVQQVLENLQAAISAKQALLSFDPLPKLLGNESQLIQLLQNLISNALKFVPADRIPTVRISVALQQESWILGIHDNGIGIAPEYLHQIFEVFQRLPAARNYPGSGIGLATCKRIVENHGGRIWVDSQLNIGTTFYVALPRTEDS